MEKRMNCPFCNQEMTYKEGQRHGLSRLDEEFCQNKTCKFHDMPRYARTYDIGILSSERIILTDTMYVSIRHQPILNKTSIYKLDIVALSNEVILPRALKLDLSDISTVIDKIKILLMFS